MHSGQVHKDVHVCDYQPGDYSANRVSRAGVAHQRGYRSVPGIGETRRSANWLLKGPEGPSQVLRGLVVN